VRIATTPSKHGHQKVAVQREEHDPSPVLSSYLQEKRPRFSFVGMDGFGIVYLIENAQEFWLGALWRHPHLRSPY